MNEWEIVLGKRGWKEVEKYISSLDEKSQGKILKWVKEYYYDKNMKNKPKFILVEALANTLRAPSLKDMVERNYEWEFKAYWEKEMELIEIKREDGYKFYYMG